MTTAAQARARSLPPPPRIPGVDAARGVATLCMVQGHAYDAWVAEPFRSGPAFALTRVLTTLALPAFLLLAGAGVGLRVRAGLARGESPDSLRSGLVKRGLSVLLWGYATSLGFALMDGGIDAPTLLRADVLHVIGLSIALISSLGVRGTRADPQASVRRLRTTCWAALVLPTVLCPWLSSLLPGQHDVAPWLKPAVALFIDVPGYTRMPVVPLIAWAALGALLTTGGWPFTVARSSPFSRRSGIAQRSLVGLAAASLAAAVGGTWLTHAGSLWLGGPLTRSHPAVVFNVLDLAGRGGLVLCAGAALAGVLPGRLAKPLTRVGQASLPIYVAHLPFCYGRLGKGLAGRLSMAEASLWVFALLAACFVGVALRARLRKSSKQQTADTTPAPPPTAVS